MNQEKIIIGLTGPVGSGCTFFAKRIQDHYGYPIFPLSKYIHEICEKEGGDKSPQHLQDVGNKLRNEHGNAYLVEQALKEIDELQPEGPVVIDSIRNLGEVQALSKYPNFFLLAIDAPKDVRKQRKGDLPSFEEYDQRDSDENLSYGQQVRQCIYFSDIVIYNGSNLETGSEKELEYIEKNLIHYIKLILNPGSALPSKEETIMTLAYALSLRSRCLKRGVGAVITTEDGDIISTGYNDVPSSLDNCQREYGQCFKDKTRIDNINKIHKCPKCGGDILTSVVCPRCGKHYDEYRIVCGECHTELRASRICTQCETDIIKEFDVKDISRCRALHAEENAIIKLTRFGGGVSLKNTRLYVTTFPCKLCANKIREVGIREVMYVEPYPDKDSASILQDAVSTKPFYGVKSKAFFKLYGAL